MLLVRSQVIVAMWGSLMSSSCSPTSLHECLSLAHKLVSISRHEDVQASHSQAAMCLPTWIEIHMLVESLTAHHCSRARNVENLEAKIREQEVEMKEVRSEAEKA